MNKMWRYVVSMGLIIAMVGCNRAPDQKELNVIKEMSSMMRTQCVGRYLIDLPESFVWNEFPEVELYYGLDADFKPVSVQIVDVHSNPEKFNERVSRRIAAIAADENLKTNNTMLLEHRDLDVNRILIKRYHSILLKGSYTYEIHQLIGNTQVFLKANSFPEDKRSAEEIIIRLASQLRLAEGPLEHQGPGFCLGPVLIDADNDNEILINHFARDKRHLDVQFEVYMNAITPDTNERLPDQITREQTAFAVRPKFLRNQQTQVGPMQADEVLMRFEEKGLIMHSFGAWSGRDNPSLTHPMINLGLSTGGEISVSSVPDLLRYGPDGSLPKRGPSPRTVSSSLTDNEAIGLWDAIIKSIRLRSNAVRNAQ